MAIKTTKQALHSRNLQMWNRFDKKYIFSCAVWFDFMSGNKCDKVCYTRKKHWVQTSIFIRSHWSCLHSQAREFIHVYVRTESNSSSNIQQQDYKQAFPSAIWTTIKIRRQTLF